MGKSIKSMFEYWLHHKAELATVRTKWVQDQCEEAYRAGRADALAEVRDSPQRTEGE